MSGDLKNIDNKNKWAMNKLWYLSGLKRNNEAIVLIYIYIFSVCVSPEELYYVLYPRDNVVNIPAYHIKYK